MYKSTKVKNDTQKIEHLLYGVAVWETFSKEQKETILESL